MKLIVGNCIFSHRSQCSREMKERESVGHRMAMRPSLLVLFLLEIVLTMSVERRTKFDKAVAEMTTRVVSEHFTMFKCVTWVLDDEVDVDLEQPLPGLVIRLPAERWILTESFEQVCGGFVVRVRNKTEAVQLLLEAKRHAIGSRYNVQRYLFLPVDETDDDLELLKNSKMLFLPNLILVVPQNGSLTAVTHTTFDHQKHEVLSVYHEVLDVWTPGKGFGLGADLYPDKLADIKGKKLVLSTVQYPPFSLVWTEGNKKMFDGFETRIVEEFVKKINGTWVGVVPESDLWGDIFPNGSATGILRLIVENKADIGYGAFYQWFCTECDCTYPFYQSAVTCLVPRPALVPGWLTIILPFEFHTWVALIVVYMISSLSVFALILGLQHQKGLKIKNHWGMAASDAFFTNFRLQLQQIPVVPKSKQPVAVYIKITVYYYFFVAAFWQGGIASFLTVPRFEDPINNAEDLVNRWPKVKWGSNSYAWMNSLRDSTEPNSVQIVDKFLVLDHQTLLKNTKTRDFAFFMEKLPHGHYGFSDFITEESMKYLRIMETNIYIAFGVLMLPRGSPYSEKFDRIVLWLFDTGIVHKTEVQVSLDRVNNRLQNMIKYSNAKDSSTVILAIRHIQGPILIYLGGMSLAVLLFFLEILNKNISMRIVMR